MKPNQAIFALALEKAKAKATETLYIGDQYKIDIAGARAAGIKAVLIDRDDFFPEADCPRIRGLGEVAGYV
jgi:putative hydrolase of the HAD superfamily